MDRWKHLKILYQSAAEKDPHERAAFLDEACAGDEDLRLEVESLLIYANDADRFMEAPALEIFAQAWARDPSGLLASGTIAHYRILSFLGSGGMGEVYLAEDIRLDRKVAIKILSPYVAQNAGRMRRFTDEAKAASALNHANVATIYDIGEADGIHFITMEYVEGQTLSQKLLAGPFSIDELVKIAIQVADALDTAHTKGITHRDIKSANLMVTPRGQVKVLDFGLATIASVPIPAATNILPRTGTLSGWIMGTLEYMSPEQVMRKEVDHRSDIFSLGVVLYEMSTGRLPFASAGSTAMETMDRVLHMQPDPIVAHGDRTTEELYRIVRKCLEKDRDRRYPSVSDLLGDLRSLQFETQAAGGQATTPRSLWNRRLSITALSLALLAAVVVAILIASRPDAALDSIAVLPFDASGDPDTEYLSDGLTQGLINSLMLAPQLRVIPPTMVMPYKGAEKDPVKTGNQLNVLALVTGNVTVRGDRLTVQAELVDVQSKRPLWRHRYEQKLSSILEIQDEIVQSISDSLRLQLSGEDQKRLIKHYTDNAEAYQLYLKGRYHWNKFTPESLRTSGDYFVLAFTLDSRYALAYAGLSDVYILRAQAGEPPMEMYPNAKFFADKALEIDPLLPEAHTARGAYEFFYGWDWATAEDELLKAIALKPNFAGPHDLYGQLLLLKGQREEGVAEVKRAVELDQLSPLLNADLGFAYYYTGEYDLAETQELKALEASPDASFASYVLGLAYTQQGKYRDASDVFAKTRTWPDGFGKSISGLAYLMAVSGRREEAQKMLLKLQTPPGHEYMDPYYDAVVYMSLGNRSRALDSLKRAADERSTWLPPLNLDPKFESLRTDPRFLKLVQTIGLTKD